jgi:hypothetical protein
MISPSGLIVAGFFELLRGGRFLDAGECESARDGEPRTARGERCLSEILEDFFRGLEDPPLLDTDETDRLRLRFDDGSLEWFGDSTGVPSFSRESMLRNLAGVSISFAGMAFASPSFKLFRAASDPLAPAATLPLLLPTRCLSASSKHETSSG